MYIKNNANCCIVQVKQGPLCESCNCSILSVFVGLQSMPSLRMILRRRVFGIVIGDCYMSKIEITRQANMS